MAGRPRKPSALKLLHGDFEKDPQRENKREPKPKLGRPSKPRRLQGEAKREWERICKELEAVRCLTKNDRAALHHYCEVWELRARALAHVQKHGSALVQVLKDGTEKIIRNPWDVALMEYSRACLKYQIEFGLTPVSRSRIVVETEAKTKTKLQEQYLA